MYSAKHVGRLAALAAALLVVCLGTGAVPAATPQTVVTIGFDDGYADQYGALSILNAHGMHATFFVNSGFIGDSTHLSLAQLTDLYAAGNEIGGHTTNHKNIKKLKTGPARQEVCGDRNTLLADGFQPTSFAYPFGSFDAGSEQVVADCGYNSGRGVSGINDRRVFAEAIPPLNAYATRVTPSVKQGTTLATIEGYITAAEQHGGGWVQLVFHHVCNQCDVYAITPADFSTFLDWLQPRSASGTVVQTTAIVIGGTVKPPVAP